VGATPLQFGPGGVVGGGGGGGVVVGGGGGGVGGGGGETTTSPEAETETVQSAAATSIDLWIFDIAFSLTQ
jgi:hypothetical protein